MTTTTLSGFNLTYDENDNPIFKGTMSVDFTYDEDLKVSYSVVEDGRRGILNQPEVDIDFTDGYLSFSKGPFDGQIHVVKLVFTDGSTASVLSISDIYEDQDYVFLIDSSPGFVVPTDQASVNDLYSKIQSVELPTGQFAPDTEFSFSDIPAGVSVENDVFEGTDGDDVINSGSGDDVIYGRGGDDSLNGGVGDDTIDGGPGEDMLFYEGVYDGVSLNNTASVKDGIPAFSAVSSDGLNQDTFSNVENFHLSHGDDVFHTDSDGYVFMRSGNDTAYIAGASALIIPGSGADTIIADIVSPSSLAYSDDGYDNFGIAEATINTGIQVSYDGQKPSSLSGQVIDGWGDTDTFIGINRIDGTDLADTMSAEGTTQSVRFEGFGGNDVLIGGSASDRLDGGAGDDTLNGGAGDDDLYGGEGNDRIITGGGNSHVEAGDGNDFIDASGLDELNYAWIMPGQGSNQIIGSSDTWALRGWGIDISYADVETSGGLIFDVGVSGTGTVSSRNEGVVQDTFSFASRFRGTVDNDTFQGSSNSDWEGWEGQAGNDTIHGGGGFDELLYHQDWANGGVLGVTVEFDIGTASDAFGATDTFTGIEAVRGTPNSDTFEGSENISSLRYRGLDGNDIINGSSSYDIADYSRDANYGGLSGIAANLRSGEIQDGFGAVDTVALIDEVRGTEFSDIMTAEGTTVSVRLEGYDGNDALTGGAGDDRLNGGDGDDTLTSGDGNDSLYGNQGDDIIVQSGSGKQHYDGGDGIDTYKIDIATWADYDFEVEVNLETGFSGLKNDPGNLKNDSLVNIENVDWSNVGWNTYLTGDGADNILTSGSGNDTLKGGLGNDSLFGGAGLDLLEGGSGDDYINPGDNDYYDDIIAGTGSDIFDFSDISDGYVHLHYWKLDAGISLDIDGTLNSGSVDKGINGFDTFLEISNALSSSRIGGVGVDGSSHNDEFSIQTDLGQWLQVKGGHGADTYSFSGDGTIRLDLNGGDQGVDVNLASQIIVNDGYGNTETYTGELWEVRSTNHNDKIIGSALNESFILLAGTDSLDGGDGFDLVRYDRNGVRDGIDVNLGSGVATGQWSSVSFQHYLNNIEHVRGGSGDDLMVGDVRSNRLEGKGGHDRLYGGDGGDTIDGGAGNDILTGGSGADTFQFHGVFDHDKITDYNSDEDTLEFYAADGSALQVLDLLETINADGHRVLTTADGLSSVTLANTGEPISPSAFDIVLSSQTNGIATFAIYADETVDPDNDGTGSFEFTLSHDPADMLIDAGSYTSGTGYSGVPNYNSTTGVLQTGAFALPNVTDTSIPLATFSATILNETAPISLTISDALVDADPYDGVTENFDFSSVSVTVTTLDRFGNSLTPDEVVAYEAAGGNEIFIREVGTSDNNTVFEIVADPTSEFSSLDFELTDYAGLVDFTLSSALSDWITQTNTSVADTVAFAGFSNDLEIAAGQETVLATFTSSADPDFDISGIKLDGAAQPDVSVGEIPASSTNGNVTVFETSAGTTLFVDANKDIDDASDNAIGAFDALQALRLAVGLDKSDGTSEWHDYIAADINQDGRVGADDALNILKFAVGLTDGPSAEWVFVDGDADYSGIERGNTNYDQGVMLENVIVDTSINVTGILVGDVDGSYVV